MASRLPFISIGLGCFGRLTLGSFVHPFLTVRLGLVGLLLSPLEDVE